MISSIKAKNFDRVGMHFHDEVWFAWKVVRQRAGRKVLVNRESIVEFVESDYIT